MFAFADAKRVAHCRSQEASENYTYQFKGWDKPLVEAESDAVYTAVYDSSYRMVKNGAIRAAFKVSDSTSVYFSQGNLQFNAKLGTHETTEGAKDGTWRFAEHQYDIIGEANENISETYDGWIDLFGWGTSGWKSKATCYQPWSKSESYSDYYPGDSESNNLTGDYANADWGVYNAISNGGNEPNKWRTLTTSEWQYLFRNNKWTLGYIKTTEKDSCLCFMLIPETFTNPKGTTVGVISSTTPDNWKKYFNFPSTNKYTKEQFASLEKLGVVALPCGGYRFGTSVNKGGSGYYWSSSAYGESDAYVLDITSWRVSTDGGNYRHGGMLVRLVQDL